MRNFYILLAILFPSVIFAQSNYHEGFILKNNGDTLKGYINYREWTKSPKLIDFKNNKDDKQAQQFSPQIIKGFQITGMETYLVYRGLVSMDKTNFSEIPDKLDTIKKNDTVFLKQLTTGKNLTLYYLNDDIKARYFIAEENAQPVELKYYAHYNEAREIIYLPVYKGQLSYYINKFHPENNKLIRKANNTSYQQTDLISFIDAVNDNKTATVNKKSDVRYFAGFAINDTKTTINGVYFTNKGISTNTIAPIINIGADLFDNPNVQQFIFRGEIAFTYASPKYIASETTNGPVAINSNVDYSFKQYNISFTPQVIYNFYNTDKLKVYADGGIRLNLSTYTNDRLIVVNTGGENDTKTMEKPYVLDGYWVSIPLQLGVTLNKKLEFSFSYVNNARYTRTYNINAFNVSNQSMNLGVRFYLDKY